MPEKKHPYATYASSPDLFKDFVLEDLRGQAMYMQDFVDDLCDVDENPKDANYFMGFHDILGHIIEMTECDGDKCHPKDAYAKEVERRVQILKGSLDAMNALLEMTKSGEFRKEN